MFCSPCFGLFHVWVISNVPKFVLYACPQLRNDAKYDLSGVFGFGNADVNKEDSSDHSSYNNNGGKSVAHLPVLCCVDIGSFP